MPCSTANLSTGQQHSVLCPLDREMILTKWYSIELTFFLSFLLFLCEKNRNESTGFIFKTAQSPLSSSEIDLYQIDQTIRSLFIKKARKRREKKSLRKERVHSELMKLRSSFFSFSCFSISIYLFFLPMPMNKPCSIHSDVSRIHLRWDLLYIQIVQAHELCASVDKTNSIND